jgi:hypothetical protein
MLLNINKTIVSNNVQDPSIFGPALWFTLHINAVNYPQYPTIFTKKNMINLLENLYLLIPCVICREHYISHLSKVDVQKVVNNRDNLFKFFVDIHNIVNKYSGKNAMSLQEAKNLYGFETLKTNISINYK